MKKIDTAVILAAGWGKRLKKILDGKPKGFLQFGDYPIVEESIIKLIKAGIKTIIIVTGYYSKFYADLARRYKNIKLVNNKNYRTTGSMGSLACAKNFIAGDFLLLESDLVYEKRALKKAIAISRRDCILASGKTNSNDEVFIEVKRGRITNLSKYKDALSNIYGELVGISKISKTLYRKMLDCFKEKVRNNPNMEYDTGCIAAIVKKHKIYPLKIEDLLWAEVDDENHYKRVKTSIYPAIIKKDGKI